MSQKVVSGLKGASDQYRYLALLAIAYLIYLREPNLLLYPRFWAEEGRDWFKMAYLGGFPDSLFFLYSKNGYLNLAANLSATLASWFPIEYAPYVTTYLSFAYWLVVFAVILWNDSDMFVRPSAKLIACAIVLLASTNHEEIWLNSHGIMGLGGICTLFILLDEPNRGGSIKKHAHRILLAFNTLSGPYSVVLTIPFFLKLWLDGRSRNERAIQCGIVLTCALTQAAIYLYSLHLFGILDVRAVPFSLYKSAIYVFKWQLLDPVLGFTLADKIFGFLGLSITGHGNIHGDIMASGSLFFVLLVVSISLLLWLGRKDANQFILITSYVIVAAFTAYCSLFKVPHNRYAVMPGAIILLALFNVIRLRLPAIGTVGETLKGLNGRALASLASGLAAAILLCLSLSCGAKNYWHITFNDYTNAPLWRDEVAEWRLDPHHPLRIFPHPQWKIHLNPKQ